MSLNLLSSVITDKMEVEAPLDLSVTASRLKVEYCTDDSDDSDGHGPNADPNCKAYKKSLMKRYCEFILNIVTNIYFCCNQYITEVPVR